MKARTALNAAAAGVSAIAFSFLTSVAANDAHAQTVPPGSAAAQSCTMKYDANRGVFPGDCYSRQEVEKFVCLDSKPASRSPSCDMASAQLPISFGSRAAASDKNLNIFTSKVSREQGYTFERDGNNYHTRLVISGIEVNHGSAIPSWAKAAQNPLIAKDYDARLAAISCNKTQNKASCMPHDEGVANFNQNGHTIVMGGKAQSISSDGSLVDGQYMMLRLAADGSAAVTLTDKYGAQRHHITLQPAGRIVDNIAKLQGAPTSTPAIIAAITPQ